MNRIRMTILRTAITTLIAAWAGSAGAQLSVNPQTNVQSLAAAITGQGVRISNPVISCHAQGYGEFSYTGSVLGVSEGVLLTTGRITNALGPNNVENRTFEQGTAGNTLLNTVTGRTTYDACRLEFDVVPGGDTLRFNFAFASEEYNEWVGSQYNDVFGFFISGPGIVGDPGIGNEKNIALVPNTNQAVTINNVNNGSNKSHYIDNAGGQHIQYDGITKGLQAVAAVQPCQTYRLKLIVADASDRKFDSGVFIERIQSNSVTMQSFTASGFPNLVEGCHPGSVRFTRQRVTPTPLDVPFFLVGTATNGSDYTLIGDPDPTVAKIATIPGGQASTDIHFDPIADGIPEVSEIVRIRLGSSVCPGYYLDSLDLVIQDSLFATVNAPVTICPGGSAALQAGGGLNYAWTPPGSLNIPTSSSPIASPTSTTSYNVVVSAGDCSASLGTSVSVNGMTLSAATTRPLCNGQNNGAINLTVSGGTAPFSYSWAGPSGFTAATEDLSGIRAGTYTVTVTDGTSCTVTQSFNLTAPAVLSLSTTPSILPFGQNISCFGGSDGSITLAINGGTGPYQTSWTGPNGFSSSNKDLSGIPAGEYAVTVTDINGCSATAARTLVQPPAVALSLSDVAPTSCAGSSDGSATVNVLGGMPPYTHVWNTIPSQNGSTATGLAAGTYTCTVTDGYGCAGTIPVTITAPDPLSVTLSNVNSVFQCQGQQNPHGSATAVASGGTAPYSHVWNTVPEQNTATANFTSGGTYTVTVTDANGCTASQQVTVSQSGQADISVVEQTDALCGEATGSATVAVSGGPNAQSITWSSTPEQTGTTATGLPPGSYTVTAQHANGCQSTTTVIIAGSQVPLSVSITDVQGVSCFGGNDGQATAVVSGGTGPYDHVWNNDPTLDQITATGLGAGLHSVTVTDANGCTAEAHTSITGPGSALQVNITGYTNVLCFETEQGTAEAMAIGGTAPYNYEWDSDPVQSGPSASGLAQGTYTVTATDANGCTATTTVDIGGPQFGVEALIETYSDVTCFGGADGSATLTVSGGSGSYTITWMVEPPQNGLTVSGLPPGNYTVKVEDNNGCDTEKFVDFTIAGPEAPLALHLVLSDHNGFNVSCHDGSDGSIDVTVSGGYAPYAYQWTDLHGNMTGIQNLSGLDADTYMLTVIDARGCTIDSTIVLTAPTPIVVNADITTAACQGSPTGAIDATISGGISPLSASWTGPNGFTSDQTQLYDLMAGVYNVTVVDANGCTANRSFDVSEPGVFQVTATLSGYPGGWHVSCAQATDGAIDVTVTGGTGPYLYAWVGPGINDPSAEDQNGLGAGTYTLTVTDANGCSRLAAYTLSAPPPLTASLQPGTYGAFNISCAGADDGFINATINGGTVFHDIQWTGPDGFAAGTVNIFDLAPGTYTLNVTDANGCGVSASRTLIAPTAVSADLSPSTSTSGDAIACNGGATGSVDLTVTGGAQPYTTTWEGPDGYGSTEQDITGLMAGTYAVTITDANGCTQVLPITLTEPSPIVVNANATDHNGVGVSCSGHMDGGMEAVVSGGAGTFSLSWNGPNGFTSNAQDLSGLESGSYTLTATDANGCSASATIILEEPEALAAIPALSDHNGHPISCPGATDGSIILQVDGGTAPIILAWNGPGGFTSDESALNGLGAGTYTVTISDANGCILQDSFTLDAPQPLAIDLTPDVYSGGHNVSCSGADDGAVDMTINGGTAPFTVLWTDGLGFTSSQEDIANVGAGIYHVTVTDVNGCETSETIALTSPQPLGLSATLSGTQGANISCFGGTDGSITLGIEGGTVPYEVAWSNGGTNETMTGLGAGIYAVTVTDANGCTATASHTLEAPTDIGITLIPSSHPNGHAMACADGSDGTLSAEVQGGTPGYDLDWSGPNGFSSANTDLQDLEPGTYVLTVTDANGCTGTASIVLDAPPAVTVGTNAVTYNGGYQISCAGNTNGQASASASGGSGPFTYHWNGPNGYSSTGADLSGLGAGLYTVTATDANGCTASADIILNEPDALDLDLLLSDVGEGFNVGCDGSDGSINASVSGGTAEYTYSWTGPMGSGSTDPSISGLPAGTYHLTVTDANGCVFETNATLTRPTPVEMSFIMTPNTCPGDATGSISANASGGAPPYDLSWSGPDGFNSTDAMISGLLAGTYTVTAIDALGCSSTISTVLQGPEAIISGTYLSFYGAYNLQCAGDSTGVIEIAPHGGTAPYEVSTQGPGGFSSDANGLHGLIAGEYLLSITDANGCAMDTTITLTQPDLGIETTITVSVYPSGTNVSCFDGSDGWIEAEVTGGVGPYTFTWRGPDSLEFDTPDITGLPAGNYAYELVVTDGNQCSFFTEVTLTQPDLPITSMVTTSFFEGGHQVSCADASDGSITMTASGGSGGYDITWEGPDGYTAQGNDLSSLGAGSYTATITDMNGCTAHVDVPMNAPHPFTIALGAFSFPGGTHISCAGSDDGEITAMIDGGTIPYSLTWNGPDGFSSTNAMINGLKPGEYCLTATDTNGCGQQVCLTLNGPAPLAASATPRTAACGQDIGEIALATTGGSLPYAFDWSNGASTQDLEGLAPGAYEVIVSDANGCTTSANAVVDGTPAVTAIGTVTNNLCHGDAHGSIGVEVTGGTAPFLYLWDNGETSADLASLVAGAYGVMITDANGCSADLEFLVSENDAIVIDTLLSVYHGGYNVSTHGGDDGSIAATLSGGTAPYSYAWSTGSQDADLSGLPAGTYTLEVTDANGCTASMIVTLTEPDDLIMPTGFSPNADGANDRFVIQGLDAYPSNTFVVLNRWGNVVYDRLNYRNDWEGENIRNQPLPDGTYFVILKVNNGERTLQGYVDLRR